MKFIIKRKVKDYDAWKKVFTDLDGLRKSYGSKGATVYRNANDPNEVYVIFDWADRKSYHEYLDRPDVKKVLVDTGTFEVFEVGETFSMEE